MDHSEFARLVDNARTSGSVITTNTPVKVILKSGDVVDVEEVKFSHVDGGQIQIIAGLTYEEMLEAEADDAVIETRKH